MSPTTFNRRYDFIGALARNEPVSWVKKATRCHRPRTFKEEYEPRPKQVRDPAIRPSHLSSNTRWPCHPYLKASHKLPVKLPVL